MKTYTVAVRALCQFAAKQGDLDLRFTPSPTSQQGIAGHQTVAASRSATHCTEVSLSAEYKHLVVRGRADDFEPERQVLEEVKTFKGDLDLMPTNHRHLHWAQAKVYAAMPCRQFGLPALTVSLVYFDIDKQQEAPPLRQHCTATDLHAFFEALCECFIEWAELELAHRALRDAALTRLRFPHEEFRAGQRELAKAVFNAARLGRCLLAQAPAGIGKTVATLFPMLKACPGQELDKVFFLTAKGSGRALALGALQTLRRSDPELPLRVIELVARNKSCEHPDKVCHGESCPLAKGFYDRLPAARSAAMAADALTRESLRKVALAHSICPWARRWPVGATSLSATTTTSSTAARCCTVWCSLTHGGSACWRMRPTTWSIAPGRCTAPVNAAQLRAVRVSAPPALKKPLDRLYRRWTRLVKESPEQYTVLDEPPRTLTSALQDATSVITEHLAAYPAGVDSGLLQFYFDALQFTRLLDTFGTHSIFDITRESEGTGAGRRTMSSTLCIRNVVPASFLKPRFAAARSTVLFSATLTPWNFYADMLGLPDDTAWLDVPAPFSAEQLSVRIVSHVSTRYQHRTRSLAPIGRIIARQYAAAPGNYIAFLSSFEYLEQAADAFSLMHPDVPTWHQGPRMGESEREAFLGRFLIDGRGVGFAVLGGSFAEGIDLVGTRLVGAFIATLGLPQFNPVNKELRRRLAAKFGAGYDYTYLFPGIRKVVQAAGRVIRSASDRGTVHLIDDRFARTEVLRLLPTWWDIETECEDATGAQPSKSFADHQPAMPI